MENGSLVISLDFELLWGVFDKVEWKESKGYFQNTRVLIPRILELFDKHEISCTWATVGMLFNESWDEWNHNHPEILPEYENIKLSAYQFGKTIQSKETEELCFAPDLIKLIKGFPNQEMGTHTYSHYYCLESGQSPESFKKDLMKAKQMAKKFEINFNSLVFPRNQYNPEYLQICRDQGIQNVRSNPENWYWEYASGENLQKKIFRTGDAYVGRNDKSYKVSEISKFNDGLLAQKASRFLRPYTNNAFINKLKLQRIKEEISYAAKNGEIYHLWWHPHNFGGNPDQNLNDLEILLDHFRKCQNKFGFQSQNMEQIFIKVDDLKGL